MANNRGYARDAAEAASVCPVSGSAGGQTGLTGSQAHVLPGYKEPAKRIGLFFSGPDSSRGFMSYSANMVVK